MKILNKIFLLCLTCIVYSCSTSTYFGDEKLGDGYFLCKDGKYKLIEYSPNENYKGDGGYTVISENVKKINFNKTHIIVLTLKYESPNNEIQNFWIIDKTIPVKITEIKDQDGFNKLLRVGLVGPLDSLDFYSQMKTKNINLKFIYK
jgi:hypothetical protein